MSPIRHIKIDIHPVPSWSGETYSVRIEVQGRSARYCREQVMPSSAFGSRFDEFMCEAIDSIIQEINSEPQTDFEIGIPT